jgi:CRISPR-associated protein Cas1
MQLVLNTAGLKLSKKNHAFLVESAHTSRTISPKKITSIAITTRVLIGSDAVTLAIKNQIPILFFDRIGKAQARLWSPYFTGIATLRRQQMRFADHPLATQWIIDLFELKTEAQVATLQFLRRKRPALQTPLAETIEKMQHQTRHFRAMQGKPLAECSNTLMTQEAALARLYWHTLGESLPEPWHFAKRSRQPAADPFNAALNYLYGMLYSVVEGALFAAALDPYLGLLHADEYNRPALTFDLIEPFRPWLDALLVRQCLDATLDLTFFSQNQFGTFLNKTGKAFFIPLFNEFLQDTRRFQQREASHRNHVYYLAGKLAQRIRTFEQPSDEPDLHFTEAEPPEEIGREMPDGKMPDARR